MTNPMFNFPLVIDGRYTAVAVLDRHWEEVAKYWNEATSEQYAEYYGKIILPHFALHPLDYYTSEEAFHRIIAQIQRSGTIRDPVAGEYSPAMLQKFRHLLRRVVKVGAEHGMCLDVLWGTRFAPPTDDDPDDAEAHARTRLRKSLMPEEEYALMDWVFTNPEQSGEYMFTLLSAALGGRPQEVADLRYGNIILIDPARNLYGIAIASTVSGSGSKRGGKTRNMYRIIPISQRLYHFLMERKAAVSKAIDEKNEYEVCAPGSEPVPPIDELFICCAGNDYFTRCNLQHASNVCRDLLRRIGIKESLMRLFERETATSSDDSLWGKEKLVTSYILRRHFCTLLYALGLTEEEILYLMGHSMDHLIAERSDFRYSAFIVALADKLSRRPIMNPFPDWNAQAFVLDDQDTDSYTCFNAPRKDIRLAGSSKGGTLTITITPNEINDPIILDFMTSALTDHAFGIHGSYKTALAHGEQRETVSVISDMLRMYRDVAERLRNTSPFIRKYGDK